MRTNKEKAIKEIVLNYTQVAAAVTFSEKEIYLWDFDVSFIESRCQAGVVAICHGLLPCENLTSESHDFYCKYPATWWDHFKDNFFPSWALKRLPVTYKEKKESVTFEQKAVYPQFAKYQPERAKGFKIIVDKYTAFDEE